MKNAFIVAFAIATDVRYDPQWENGTGYLDGATSWFPSSDMRSVDSVYKSVDPDGRKILLIPIMEGRYGTHVIFERYVPNDNERPTYVQNAPVITRFITPAGALTDNDLDKMIGRVVAANAGGVGFIKGLSSAVEAVLGRANDVDQSIEFAKEMADDWGIAEHAKPDVLKDFFVYCGNYLACHEADPETITLYEDDGQYTAWQLPLVIDEPIIKLLRNAARITVS